MSRRSHFDTLKGFEAASEFAMLDMGWWDTDIAGCRQISAEICEDAGETPNEKAFRLYAMVNGNLDEVRTIAELERLIGVPAGSFDKTHELEDVEELFKGRVSKFAFRMVIDRAIY